MQLFVTCVMFWPKELKADNFGEKCNLFQKVKLLNFLLFTRTFCVSAGSRLGLIWSKNRKGMYFRERRASFFFAKTLTVVIFARKITKGENR